MSWTQIAKAFFSASKRAGGSEARFVEPEPRPEALSEAETNPDLIDVRELIAAYDVAEHARRADEYFKDFTLQNAELRKPFMSFDAPHLIAHLGIVVGELDFFPGMSVVDFGCGTGWLSQCLAVMGCRPIAVDVSQRALDLGKTYTSARYPEFAGAISYLRYDGLTIDLADGSVDRVICMDSFHHVANQDRLLGEFHRILAPDGRAIFCEPGPLHSRTRGSQHAMRAFGVIENDIIIEDIWRMAQAHGFKDLKLAAFSLQPLRLGLAELESLRSMKSAAGVLRRAYNEIFGPLYRGSRLFTLLKDPTQRDSRWREGLDCEIVVVMEDAGGSYRIHGVVKNTGTAPWRPTGSPVGAVNVGLKLKMPDGEWRIDFQRVPFLDTVMLPGEERPFLTTVAKECVGEGELYIDLVAEGVTWFKFDAPERLVLS